MYQWTDSLSENPKLFNEIARLLPEAQFIWIGEGELESELTSPNICVTGMDKKGRSY